MLIEQQIFDSLNQNIDKVFHLKVPQDTDTPFVVISFAGKTQLMSLSGANAKKNCTCTVIIVSKELLEAKQIAAEVHSVMLRATMFSVGSITEHPDQYDFDTDMYAIALEYSVWYVES